MLSKAVKKGFTCNSLSSSACLSTTFLMKCSASFFFFLYSFSSSVIFGSSSISNSSSFTTSGSSTLGSSLGSFFTSDLTFSNCFFGSSCISILDSGPSSTGKTSLFFGFLQ